MAKDKNSKVEASAVDAATGDAPLSTKDNVRLIAGFILMLIAAFIFCSIASYLFYWKADMSALQEVGKPMSNPQFYNICGQGGAKVASGLVGGGFGLFALVIPLVIGVIGWRLFRYKPLHLHKFLLIFTLVLLLGSLTLGYIFTDSWGLFGSGLGGRYGILINESLRSIAGVIGTLLIIIAGWILTGLLINRNFLHVVDNAGTQVAGGISNATRRAFKRLNRKGEEVDAADADADVESDEEQYEEATEDAVEGVDAVPQPAADEEPMFVTVPCDEDGEEQVEVEEPKGDAPMTPLEVDKLLGVDSDMVAMADDEEDTTEDDEEDTKETAEDGLVVTVVHNRVKKVDEDGIENDLYDPLLDLAHYTPPTPQLLVDYKVVDAINEDEIFQNKERIRQTLLHFHIPIISMTATVGPTVTLYEIVQEPGVKIARIQGLEDDIAQNLKAEKVRIIAPIPGKGTVGIEVPNQTKQTVSMRSAICSEEFQSSKAELPIVIGRTIQNENYTFDLAKLPHLLVAGATGQGKSVGLNAIITSLLYRKHPAELKFVLIDPKMVEFSLYNKLEKHFLAKMESEDESIVTDPRKAVYTLNSLCTEMAARLELCKRAAAKNIVEYNEKFVARRLNPENGHRYLPYIVVVIDEFADLIMTAKEVEAPVMRLAQKARAVGIHLIVATQRPDVKVITGGIKANFPARIAFRVMQMTDSRTIIDQPGANQLIGRGDMLFLSGGVPIRIQCAFVDTPEVERIVEHIGKQQGYCSAYNLPDYTPESGADMPMMGSDECDAPQKYDAKFGEIARAAVTNGVISTSMIQRNFEVGFNRAGRIMLQLERAGIVGPQIGSKSREIKFYDLQSLEAKLQDLGVS
ncbi:MAG: DNA translocase FtsK 4TM domain-containing protein [Alistipes sp.]|nr:DNA translocase FtsK 4TM domain-containing protein [Alistipes sp.]